MPDPKPDPIVAIILAGGRASRLGGGDKTLLSLAGKPLLAHLIDRLAPQVGALALSANGDPARFAAFGLPVLPDPLPGQPGPLAGILAGIDWAARRGATSLLAIAGDTPFPPADLVSRLAAAGPLAIAASPGPDGALRSHPAVGLWPVTLREPLHAALTGGEHRVGALATRLGAAVVAFEGRPDPFLNINTPADLAAARAL